MSLIPTPVKKKVAQTIGEDLNHTEIAQRVGVPQIAITRHLLCTQQPGCTARHTPEIQHAIAKALGISEGELFGAHAWFRLAAAKLEDRRRQIEMRATIRKSA